MVLFRDEIDTVLALRKRDYFHKFIRILSVFITVLVSWIVFVDITNCPSAVVVVISGSMEPGYSRGDVLLLHHRFDLSPVQVSDIVVFDLPGRHIPIVHRVVALHRRARDNKLLLLTKGDNNVYNDIHLYGNAGDWVEEDWIIGKSYAYVPRLGYITILLAETSGLRYLSVVLILFFILAIEEEL